MLKGEDSLHQAGDAGSRIEMAYVGFERSDSAVAAARSGLAKRLRKGADFDRIADDGPGSMGLDVGDVRGADASEIQSFGNDLGLAFNAGGQIADFARAIVVNCRSENDGADMCRDLRVRLQGVAVRRSPGHFQRQFHSKRHRRSGSGRREKESLLRGRYSPGRAGFRW